jgi:hypothetical protein
MKRRSSDLIGEMGTDGRMRRERRTFRSEKRSDDTLHAFGGDNLG